MELSDAQITELIAAGWTVKKPTKKVAVFGRRGFVNRYMLEHNIAWGECGDAWMKLDGEYVDVYTFIEGTDRIPVPKPERFVEVIDADTYYRPELIAKLESELAALKAERP